VVKRSNVPTDVYCQSVYMIYNTQSLTDKCAELN